ncbi:hypothetical protein [uncultured Hymenobacter sp.]
MPSFSPTTADQLTQLFPESDAAIPEQWRLPAPLPQRDYLRDGELLH